MKAKGLCAGHWLQQHRGKPLTPISTYDRVCTVPGCYRKHRSKGFCSVHYDHVQLDKPLLPLGPKKKLIANEGDIRVDERGYVSVKCTGHPHSDKYGWVREHIKVVCDEIGRPLNPGENIHHINGVRNDNRLENLELWNTKQPKGQRVEEKLDFYIEFILEYADLYPEKVETLLESLQ